MIEVVIGFAWGVAVALLCGWLCRPVVVVRVKQGKAGSWRWDVPSRDATCYVRGYDTEAGAKAAAKAAFRWNECSFIVEEGEE